MLRWRIAQFFEILWWKNYLGGKDKQEYLHWKQAYWAGFLEQSRIQLQPDDTILDAGCGPGGIFTILTNYKTDAVDPLLDKYEHELPHFSKKDWPQTHFVCSTLEDFEPKKPYNVVFCLNAINHVIDIDRCISQLTSFTQQNGTLAMSIDAHNHQWIKRLFRLLPGDILHPHQYDLPEYESMMTARGFRIDRTILIKKEWIFNYYLVVGTLKSPI
jgi:trans-aconitate methyltransferase